MESLPLIIVLTVLVFFVLIGIHEWGHYYFARRAGVLVREFAIGFGPKLFSFKKDETTFTFRLLPIGGFVQMAGEEMEDSPIQVGQKVYLLTSNKIVTEIRLTKPSDESIYLYGEVVSIDLDKLLFITLKDEHDQFNQYEIASNACIVEKQKPMQIAPKNRQFSQKTVGQRAITIFAGPLMNFILAFILFMCVVLLLGEAKNVKLSHVQPDTPAAIAGLKKNDIIVEINGQKIEADAYRLSNAIQNSLNKEMIWYVQRQGEIKQIRVTPQLFEQSPRVGVIIGSDRRPATIGESVVGAWNYSYYVTKLIFDGFKRMILGQFKIEELGGPVRTVSVTVEAAKAGFPQLVYWAAILSLYLGIFNLLPIPALDGSRLMFLAIEWVRGKPVEPRKESFVHFVGFAMLMGLMLFVTYHDIARFFK